MSTAEYAVGTIAAAAFATSVPVVTGTPVVSASARCDQSPVGEVLDVRRPPGESAPRSGATPGQRMVTVELPWRVRFRHGVGDGAGRGCPMVLDQIRCSRRGTGSRHGWRQGRTEPRHEAVNQIATGATMSVTPTATRSRSTCRTGDCGLLPGVHIHAEATPSANQTPTARPTATQPTAPNDSNLAKTPAHLAAIHHQQPDHSHAHPTNPRPGSSDTAERKPASTGTAGDGLEARAAGTNTDQRPWKVTDDERSSTTSHHRHRRPPDDRGSATIWAVGGIAHVCSWWRRCLCRRRSGQTRHRATGALTWPRSPRRGRAGRTGRRPAPGPDG